MLLDVIHTKKDKILNIAKQHHASNVRVFVSVARGEEIENNDIDLLVSFLSGASLLDQAAKERAWNKLNNYGAGFLVLNH